MNSQKTNPATPGRNPHTVVLSVTYSQPVTEDTLATWRRLLADMDGVEAYSANYGTATRAEKPDVATRQAAARAAKAMR